MKRPTEQELARYLLIHRDTGYSIAYVLRRSMVRYGILLALAAGFLMVGSVTGDSSLKGFSLWMAGMFFGAVCRDMGWLRRIKRSWPFTQKVTDWQKVEDLAAGREPAGQAASMAPSPVDRGGGC